MSVIVGKHWFIQLRHNIACHHFFSIGERMHIQIFSQTISITVIFLVRQIKLVVYLLTKNKKVLKNQALPCIGYFSFIELLAPVVRREDNALSIG